MFVVLVFDKMSSFSPRFKFLNIYNLRRVTIVKSKQTDSNKDFQRFNKLKKTQQIMLNKKVEMSSEKQQNKELL